MITYTSNEGTKNYFSNFFALYSSEIITDGNNDKSNGFISLKMRVNNAGVLTYDSNKTWVVNSYQEIYIYVEDGFKNIQIDGQVINVEPLASSGLITFTEKDLYDSVNNNIDGIIIHQNGYNDSNNSHMNTMRISIREANIEWEDGKELYIDIPERYLIYHRPRGGDVFIAERVNRVKFVAYYEGESKYWGKYLDDKYIGRRHDLDINTFNNWYANLELIPDTHVGLSVKPEGRTHIHYIVEKNSFIFNDKILALDLENDLGDHQKYYYYFDENHTELITGTDLITDNLLIYRQIGFSEDDKLYVTFDTNGGTKIPTLEFSRISLGYRPTEAVWLNDLDFEFPPEPTQEGFVFKHWEITTYSNTGNSYTSIYDLGGNRSTHRNFEFKAVWVEAETTFNVTFQSYAFNQPLATIEVEAGGTINPNQIPEHPKSFYKSNKGYRFLGWSVYQGSHNIDAPFDFNQKITEDITLYSRYEQPEQFNVSFNTNGGVYISPIEIRITGVGISNWIDFATQLPTPTKDKAIFLGWFTDEELITPVPEKINRNYEEAIEYYDITLHASWAVNSVLVRFESNAPNLELSPIIITKGDSVNISNPPKRTGYIFNGWFFDNELTQVYSGEELYEDEITLYASWLLDEDDGNGDNGGNGGNGDTGGNQDATKDNTQLFTTILVVAGVVGLVLIIGNNRKPKRRRRR